MREIDWFTLEEVQARQNVLEFPHGKFKDTWDMQHDKEHTFQDTIAEVKAWEEWANEGKYRIVRNSSKELVVALVRNIDAHEYEVVEDTGEYRTKERAELALALMIRPGRLTWQEHQRLFEMLGE